MHQFAERTPPRLEYYIPVWEESVYIGQRIISFDKFGDVLTSFSFESFMLILMWGVTVAFTTPKIHRPNDGAKAILQCT